MDLLTASHTGRLLGVGPERVRQLAARGELPHVRDSAGKRLFVLSDVLALRERRQRRHELRLHAVEGDAG
jgi:hypothetical protein